MAGAELLGLLGEALRHRVADPGGHVGAGAGQHADDDADDVAAHLRLHVLARQLELALENAAEAPIGQLGRLRAQHRPHHFRHRKHTHQRRDRFDAAEQIRDTEREALGARGVLDADAGHQQAQQHGGDRLHRRRSRHQRRAHQAEERQPEILVGREAERHLGQRRRQDHQRQRAGDAAERAEPQADAQRQLRLALARHGIGFVGVGGGGGRAGNAQQGAWNIAGEDRHGRRGDDGRHGRDRREIERHRHQQRGRHGRGQPRQRPDHQPVDGGQQNGEQHLRLQHQTERLDDRAHVRITTAPAPGRAATAPAGAWRTPGARTAARRSRAGRQAAAARRAPATR